MRPISALPKGRTFARAMIALALNKGYQASAIVFSAQRWGDSNPTTRLLIEKAAVGASGVGTVFSGENSADFEFFAAAAQGTIPGRIAGLVRMPFRTPTMQMTTGISADWVGEGAAKPIQKPVFAKSLGMERTKLQATAVFTKEM